MKFFQSLCFWFVGLIILKLYKKRLKCEGKKIPQQVVNLSNADNSEAVAYLKTQERTIHDLPSFSENVFRRVDGLYDYFNNSRDLWEAEGAKNALNCLKRQAKNLSPETRQIIENFGYENWSKSALRKQMDQINHLEYRSLKTCSTRTAYEKVHHAINKQVDINIVRYPNALGSIGPEYIDGPAASAA